MATVGAGPASSPAVTAAAPAAQNVVAAGAGATVATVAPMDVDSSNTSAAAAHPPEEEKESIVHVLEDSFESLSSDLAKVTNNQQVPVNLTRRCRLPTCSLMSSASTCAAGRVAKTLLFASHNGTVIFSCAFLS
jgi:hypothetical protein